MNRMTIAAMLTAVVVIVVIGLAPILRGPANPAASSTTGTTPARSRLRPRPWRPR
jgi:hypothetical protein